MTSQQIKITVKNCPNFVVAVISKTCIEFCETAEWSSGSATRSFSFSKDENFEMTLACAEHLMGQLELAIKTPSENPFVKKLVEGALMPIIQALGTQLFSAREGCFFGRGTLVEYNSRAHGWSISASQKCQVKASREDDYESDEDSSPSRSPKKAVKKNDVHIAKFGAVTCLEKARAEHLSSRCSYCDQKMKR